MSKNSKTYRFFEMIPGLIAWISITFPVWGSFIFPKLVAYFVISFLLFWFYQSFKSAFLAILGYFKIKKAKALNWKDHFIQNQTTGWIPYAKITHVIIISSYKEPVEILDQMVFQSLANQQDIDLSALIVILGQEQRAGVESNRTTANYFRKKYAHVFGGLIFTEHPPDLPGEIAGKHTNEAWAARYFKKHYIDSGKYSINNLTLTSCDVDTIFHPKYFSALSYEFASNPARYVRFWQSPIFWHHNINSVPAPIRIIGTMGSAIHISNLQEPDGLFFNYSCYSSSYHLIDRSGYWDPDMIPEDWHIFLQSFFATGGLAAVEPIFLPTLVDAPDGQNYYQAMKNRYQQCVRHAWGAIDIPYALSQALAHPEIPFVRRFLRIGKLLETHFIWSSNWFILTLGTSLPVIINPTFFQTSIGFNLPRISNLILTICLIPLFILIVLDWLLRPQDQKKSFKIFFINFIQWPLMPLATLFLSVLPGLHSHTRLMLGKRLEYKTTVKKANP